MKLYGYIVNIYNDNSFTVYNNISSFGLLHTGIIIQRGAYNYINKRPRLRNCMLILVVSVFYRLYQSSLHRWVSVCQPENVHHCAYRHMRF